MTSIEWLIEELTPSIALQQKYIDELKEKAKKMHKQEVMNAFNQGHREGWIDGMGLSIDDRDVETFQDANLYYQQNFKKD
jgi:hypothetical protein